MSYSIRFVSPVDNSDAYLNIQWDHINSTTIKFACEMTSELRIIFQQTLFRTIIDPKDLTMIKAYAEAYNEIINKIFSQKIRNSSKRCKTPCRDLIDELLTKFNIRSDDIFIHLDCSFGYIPLQIAAMISCQKSIGIENNSDLYRSAKVFEKEFRFWMK